MKISVPLRVALALIITNKTHAFSAPPISLTGRFPYSSTKTVAICMTGDKSAEGQRQKKRQKLRDALGRLTNVIAKRPIAAVAPQAIAEIITDAIKSPLDLALEEVGQVGGMRQSLAYYDIIEKEAAIEGDTARALDTIALAKTTAADAFALAESAIEETEEALTKSKLALALCREDVAKAIANAEKSAYQANVASQKATVLAASVVISASGTSVQDPKKTEVATNISTELEGDKPETIIEKASSEPAKEVSFDVSALTYEDVDYHMSEMQPPFIGEDQCLVPGEAVVRVEKATDNSRRIFAGIDIMASVDDVWNVLIDYENLQRVVPNLVVNEVVERYNREEGLDIDYEISADVSSEEQCKALSRKMKGSKLKQVGGAKVIGINFSAQVTVEVREWPNGMPDFFHFSDDVYEDVTRAERAKMESKRKLKRYRFPRPFAISKLPTKDISMQSVENDDGEFRLYQGVWRMQPLPGCAPVGGAAMRLTYAVEISPRSYLPVALVEGRISNDLCNNMVAIRDFVTKDK
eukprot:scaffold2612_cov267-Chaetoceros_neogracile.AAC.24